MMSFDVLSLETDVKKSYLLEASAGTGKTFTIEHLVARRLIEEPPLLLKEILVVTFTRAAASDLRERIRKNLKGLLDGCQVPYFKEMNRKRIQEALFCFEEAEIFTIHGFSAKMLREIGLEEIQGEEGVNSLDLAKEVVREAFRSILKSSWFSQAQIKKAIKQCRGIDKLEKEIAHLVTKRTRGVPLKNYSELLTLFKEKIASLKSRFPDEKEHMSHEEELFENWIEEGSGWYKKVGKARTLFRKALLEEIKPIIDEASSKEAFLVRVSDLCQERFLEACQKASLFQFDELLVKLRQRLEDEDFLKAIQERYKVIIIDEFQDTDPIQWEIFQKIWDPQKIDLYIVGDPKQSIYAFRKADIYTYLNAAKAIFEQRTLDTNFRSEKDLVEALNHLFRTAKQGNWLHLPKLNKTLPYHPVHFGGKVAKREFSDDLGAFHWMVAEKERGSEERLFFPYIVSEIQKLNISYKDIAILVSTHAQAERLSEALKKGGIPYILQRKGTLKGSKVLAGVFDFFSALFSLHDERLVKLFLSSCLVGWKEEDLATFSSHPLQGKVMSQAFLLKETLQVKGVASCLYQFLEFSWDEEEETLGEKLLKSGREDLLEDFFQLIENLSGFTGDEKLLEILEGLMEGDFEDDPIFQKRIDSTKEAVSILTLHASKGLEFPVVFAIGLMRKTKASEKILTVTTEEGLRLIPIWNEEALEFKEFCEELNAEKVRQLYVALTRAKHRIYVPCILEGMKGSPMELFIGENPKKFLEEFTLSTKTCLEEKEIKQVIKTPPTPLLIEPPAFPFSFTPKVVKSFSSIAKGHVKGKGAPFDFKNPVKNRHTLPGGSFLGTWIHELLEKISFQDFSLEEISSHAAYTPFEGWEEVIFEMVQDGLKTVLPKGFSLEQVQEEIREMEFFYDGLKGVIDLIIYHRGLYYIIDWKSNWLGEDETAYEFESLHQAMEDNEYFLQEALYREALKKYLQVVSKRPFEEIFGGTFYLFLRGMDGSSRGIYFKEK